MRNFAELIKGLSAPTQAPAADAECGSCREPFVDPVQLPCAFGHVFCRLCAIEWLADHDSCPLDRERLYEKTAWRVTTYQKIRTAIETVSALDSANRVDREAKFWLDYAQWLLPSLEEATQADLPAFKACLSGVQSTMVTIRGVLRPRDRKVYQRMQTALSVGIDAGAAGLSRQ